MSNSIYKQILGDDFLKLHVSVQEMYGYEKSQLLAGKINVKFQNKLARFFCKLLKVLPEGENQEIILSVTSTPQKDFWMRKVGNCLFRTTQTQQGGLIKEKFGPMTIYSRLFAFDGKLFTIFERSSFWGIKIPKKYAVQSYSITQAIDNYLYFYIEVKSLAFGSLFTYEGHCALLKG